MAQLDQRRFDRVGHAVEHLELIAARRQPARLRFRKRMSNAADVVARDRGAEHVVALDEETGLGLEVGVRLAFLGEHRHGPVVLGGDDGLIVPVGSFHEPDPDRGAAPHRPVGERL